MHRGEASPSLLLSAPQVYNAHASPLTAAAFSPSASRLVTGDGTGVVLLWSNLAAPDPGAWVKRAVSPRGAASSPPESGGRAEATLRRAERREEAFHDDGGVRRDAGGEGGGGGGGEDGEARGQGPKPGAGAEVEVEVTPAPAAVPAPVGAGASQEFYALLRDTLGAGEAGDERFGAPGDSGEGGLERDGGVGVGSGGLGGIHEQRGRRGLSSTGGGLAGAGRDDGGSGQGRVGGSSAGAGSAGTRERSRGGPEGFTPMLAQTPPPRLAVSPQQVRNRPGKPAQTVRLCARMGGGGRSRSGVDAILRSRGGGSVSRSASAVVRSATWRAAL